MQAIDDNSSVRSRTDLLLSHEKSQVKVHTVYDADDRPIFIFTANIDAINGAPCMCTEYAYVSASSTQISDQQERIYKWNTAWENKFVFDPNASYDPDGNGVI